MNLKAISVVFIAGVTMLANAQTADKPIGVGARVGAFFPTDKTTQNVGNTWLDLGIDFDVKKLTPSASLSLSLDYGYRESYRSLPLLLNYKVKRGSIYLLGGVGINFNKIPQTDGSTSGKTNFAYDLGIGYDVSTNGGAPIFIEGRFFGNKQSELNGFGAFIGIRL